MRPPAVFVAMTTTSHYEWHGIGSTADEAKDALMRAWHAHADASGADPDSLRRDEINILRGDFGQGYQDRDPLPRPDASEPDSAPVPALTAADLATIEDALGDAWHYRNEGDSDDTARARFVALAAKLGLGRPDVA